MERIELSVHTNMSTLTGISSVDEYICAAKENSMTAIAVTDTLSVQSLPNAYYICEKYSDFKLIYGTEIFYSKGEDIFPLTLLAKNRSGLKNMYKLLSDALLKENGNIPALSFDEIEKQRKNLLIGAGITGELVYALIEKKSDMQLENIISFFDYIMLYPLGHFSDFFFHNEIKGKGELIAFYKKIIAICEKLGKKVVASDNAHYVFSDDRECYRILSYHKGVPSYNQLPDLYFRSTDEMMKEFDFLEESEAYHIVVANTNAVADMIDGNLVPFDTDVTYAADFEKLRSIVYESARQKYGNELPIMIKERIESELEFIHNNDELLNCYFVYSGIIDEIKKHNHIYSTFCERTVGSSLAAYLTGISTVNPLSAHYYCPCCGYIEFHNEINCGLDLKEKDCPKCGLNLRRDGFSIPHRTLISDSEFFYYTDLELFVPKENIDRIKVGIDEKYKIVRCGMSSTLKYYTSYKMVEEYCKKEKLKYSEKHAANLIDRISEVKQSANIASRQFLILPDNKDVFDFTPIQYDSDKKSIITQLQRFDLDDAVISIDLAENRMVDLLNMLEVRIGVNGSDYFDCEKMLEKALDMLRKKDIVGIPVFSGPCVKEEIIPYIKIDSVDDIIKILGILSGDGTWTDNADMLVKNGIRISDLLSCREDIIIYLSNKGFDEKTAWSISKRVRKGKGLTEEQSAAMIDKGVPEWYIGSCKKVKYLPQKSHICSKAVILMRIAMLKACYPIEFYCECLNLYIEEFRNYITELSFDQINKQIYYHIEKGEETPEILNICKVILEKGYKFSEIKNCEEVIHFDVEIGHTKTICIGIKQE